MMFSQYRRKLDFIPVYMCPAILLSSKNPGAAKRGRKMQRWDACFDLRNGK
jgi:hypothetical protein